MSNTQTAMAHSQTVITADEEVPAIRIVREFNASRDKVYRAHTDPEILVQWLGPRSVEMEVDFWPAAPAGPTAISTAATVTTGQRSTPSTAAFTKSDPTGWCRRSPTRGIPTGCRWKR